MGQFATVEEVGEKVRPVIDAGLPGTEAALWHGHPTWSVGGAPVCFIKTYGAYVTFGFWRGQSISDPSGRLEPSAGGMAHVKLRTVAGSDVALFTDWLRQARRT